MAIFVVSHGERSCSIDARDFIVTHVRDGPIPIRRILRVRVEYVLTISRITRSRCSASGSTILVFTVFGIFYGRAVTPKRDEKLK